MRDCAFNNAGIAGDVFTPTADHTEENWDHVLDTNLKGTWLCMKCELVRMLKPSGCGSFYDLPALLCETKDKGCVESGLLPANLFHKIYFNHQQSFVIFNPR